MQESSESDSDGSEANELPPQLCFDGCRIRGLGLRGSCFDLHESEMYDCSRHAYRDRVKVVSFQAVPDQWLQTVQHASRAQP